MLVDDKNFCRKQLDMKEKERLKLQGIVEKLTAADKEHKEQLKTMRSDLAEIMKEKVSC